MRPDLADLLDQVPLFRDRREAGDALAARLKGYRGTDVLVLGLPRGGVLVAAQVARQLEGELDVLVARKLGSPMSPELAIGAVTANGGRFLNEDLIRELDVSGAYVEAVAKEQQAEARRREVLFRHQRPPPRIAARTVILVDDGLATGATMRAAVRSVKQWGPARVVVAVPVGSRQACAALRGEADAVVCLYEPVYFASVGSWYEDFAQTEDREVEELLNEAVRAAPAAPGARPC
ncbi:MAG TPA: phosphoribosyltransferase family protein [Gemmatimonadales bacterium]|nr:phosphoribosyltransferase family protein [Gemmatimonadales bacterium]